MPRFFVPSDGFDAEGKVHILGDDAYHIARALRMAAGDTLTVADMHGGEHLCRLLSIRDAECILEILESHAGRTEPPFPITLYMAYPKGDKLETVVRSGADRPLLLFPLYQASEGGRRRETPRAAEPDR